jgi:Ni/Fe-hydrogenase subunit HybB-like protein
VGDETPRRNEEQERFTQVRREGEIEMSSKAMSLSRKIVTPGHLVLLALMCLGLALAMTRYIAGIGTISNLSDSYPWGLWISFDLLCGVALAAGAFVTASAVYILGNEDMRPILRPAILTGFLGYLMVVFALLVDLGHPERIWFLMIYWNPHSVMFEVGWCVMLYTSVLALEFSPLVFERLQTRSALRLIHAITIPLVILGTVLSTLHQSSLGSLFSILPDGLNGLWFTPLLPAFFFLSAVAVGPAMVIFESTISSKVFKRGLELELLGKLAMVIPLALSAYLLLKIGDLAYSGELDMLFKGSMYTALFWIELVGGVILPTALILTPGVRRNATGLFAAACLVIAGLILNRFDTSLVGVAHRGGSYLPNIMEFAITASIVAAGVLAYSLVARFLPLFSEDVVEVEAAVAMQKQKAPTISVPAGS